MKYMQQRTAEGALWDLVVLDPPKLAPNRKSLNRALVKYRKLNTLVGAAKQTLPLCTLLTTLMRLLHPPPPSPLPPSAGIAAHHASGGQTPSPTLAEQPSRASLHLAFMCSHCMRLITAVDSL